MTTTVARRAKPQHSLHELRDERPPRSRRLRVALVAHDVHDGGGMERVSAELIRRANADVDFTVVSRTLGDDLRGQVEWRRVRAPARPFLLKYVVFFVLGGLRLRRVRADLRQSVGAIVPNRIDVAAVHFCHAGYVAATNRLAPAGAPLLRRINTTVGQAVALLAERWCYREGRTQALAAVSSGVARELAKFFPRVPVVVAPNGVDARRFRPDRRARASFRGAAGLTDDDVVALFVGGDWDRKGLAVAIEALKEAELLGVRSLQLWVVGKGDEQRFGRLATELGVAKCVRFFGFREDTEHFFQAADVFVLPSLYEAHPLSPHEAASTGLPVVVSRVNGVADLVGNDESGFVVDRAGRAVGSALAQLARDPALRARQATAARARARAFTWKRSASAIVSLYRDLAPPPREETA